MGSCSFVVFEKFSLCPFKHQIALEITLLPVLIAIMAITRKIQIIINKNNQQGLLTIPEQSGGKYPPL